MDAAATGHALFAVAHTFPAVNAVGDVSSPSRVSGGRPLQGDAGLVHRGDGVFWSRRRTWREMIENNDNGQRNAHRYTILRY